MTENEITNQIINASIEVHKTLGPGLLESVYHECLYHELVQRGLYVEKEKNLPIVFKEVKLNAGYRIDLLVNKTIIVELKSVETINDLHIAQTLTYLKLSNLKLALLINFNVPLLKNGIKRIAHNL
ncbi:MAG: GxxExxY protein [Flavobacteriales bacterium]|jgi:GxxExxY protein